MRRNQHIAHDPESEDRHIAAQSHHATVSRLQKEAEDLGVTKTRLSKEIADEIARGAQVIADKKKEVALETARLDTEIETLRVSHEKLKREDADIQLAHDGLVSLYTLLKKEHATYTTELADMRRAKPVEEASLTALQAQKNQVTKDIEHARDTLATLHREIDKAHVSRETAEEEKNDAEMTRDEAIKLGLAAVSGRDALEQEKNQLQKTLVSSREELARVNVDIARIRQEGVVIQESQEEREKDLTERSGRVSELEQWVDGKIAQLDEAKKYFTAEQLARFGISSAPKS